MSCRFSVIIVQSEPFQECTPTYSVSHRSRAIGELGYLAKYGKLWRGKTCWKSCISNLKCWNFLPRTSRYGATLFTLSIVRITAILPRWHESERGITVTCTVNNVKSVVPWRLALGKKKIPTLEIRNTSFATTFPSLHFFTVFCEITEFCSLGLMGHSICACQTQQLRSSFDRSTYTGSLWGSSTRHGATVTCLHSCLHSSDRSTTASPVVSRGRSRSL
jgi:hypothetical protein